MNRLREDLWSGIDTQGLRKVRQRVALTWVTRLNTPSVGGVTVATITTMYTAIGGRG